MKFPYLKIVIFVPSSHADAVRKAVAENGAGRFNKYDHCSFSSKGVGRFRALKGSDPFIGEVGAIEEVEEERIEVLCKNEQLEGILAAIKESHPYEEPAVDIYPLLGRMTT